MKKTTPHTPEDIARVAALLFAIKRIMRTKLARGKKRDPYTWLRIETMKFISDHKESRMKELAEHLSITAPSVTNLVSGLLKNGLVACTTDDLDRRASRLVLTKKGERELAKALAQGVTLLEDLFTGLSRKELKEFMHTLSRIVEHNT